MSRSLFSSLKDQAQSALNASPLAGRLPSALTGHQPSQQGQAPQPGQPESSRMHGLDAIQHSIRSLQAQYAHQPSAEVRQLQLLITAQKGVSLDYENVSRDAKSHSKELYLWGQAEKDDVKDVSDRLAYLNFVHGALSSSVSTAFDASRASFKAVRDAEAALAPRKAVRAAIQQQIATLKQQGGRGGGVDLRLAELENQYRKAESDDAPQERELDMLKRQALKESESKKWAALREYSEKILLLSQAADILLNCLPPQPPTPQSPYTGSATTAATRASLQRALDNYKTGHINLEHHPSPMDSDNRSFGETHASELSSISSTPSSVSIQHGNVTPPGGGILVHDTTGSGYMPSQAQQPPGSGYTPAQAQQPPTTSPPLDPSTLNNSPAPIPTSSPSGPSTYSAPVPLPQTESASYSPVPPVPTVAETGTPVVAGAAGPGPVTGSLRDEPRSELPGYGYNTGPKPETAPPPAPAHVSAEEEKRRLAAARATADAAPASADPGYNPPRGALHASTSTSRPAPPQHESAEDEKRRLQREERERILATPAQAAEEERRRLERERYPSGSGQPGPLDDEPPPGEAPPSYDG